MLLLLWATQGNVVVPQPEPQASTTGGGGAASRRGRGGGFAKVETKVTDEWLAEIWDRIHGIEKPAPAVKAAIKAVERVAQEVRPAPEVVDWAAISADVRAVKALLDAAEEQAIEDDDEDAIAALFLLLEAA